MKNNSYYFKRGFMSIAILAFFFFLVRRLFDGDFSANGLLKTFVISLLTAIITGTIIGLFNMIWWKRDNVLSAKKRG